MVISSLLNVSVLTSEVDLRKKFQHLLALIIEAILLKKKAILLKKKAILLKKKAMLFKKKS